MKLKEAHKTTQAQEELFGATARSYSSKIGRHFDGVSTPGVRLLGSDFSGHKSEHKNKVYIFIISLASLFILYLHLHSCCAQEFEFTFTICYLLDVEVSCLTNKCEYFKQRCLRLRRSKARFTHGRELDRRTNVTRTQTFVNATDISFPPSFCSNAANASLW